ncbi:YhdP family protein [Massilia litorea]|uniref:TIGR02099 family protein n=1 Tax=Massilia litorea TaxID=2769491 RepID=A0A7L9U5Y9_9BURK|nr:YhdP family protein [Massilia litorea]QOL49829.1 TIGR02099 family protein [Massilia litorea]
MHNPEPQAPPAPVPLAERWRRLRAAYRYANLASHHVLGFAVKLALLVYFGLGILFLVLRYAILPNIDLYKGDIERAASHALGNKVAIARIYATWSGVHPSLFLGDVTLTDAAGRQVLALPSVAATFSWWSVFAAEPRFETLELIRPQLDVRRGPDGVIQVAGIRIDPKEDKGGPGGDWVFRQREILIREGRIDWTDGQRGAPPLSLREVGVVLQNHWTTHKFALKATPPTELAQPLDVRARFTHPRFGGRASDVARWRGELYADLREADLAAWRRYLDYPFSLTQGRGSLRAWITLDNARLAGFTADLALSGVAARVKPELPPLRLARVSGRLSAQETLLPGKEDGKPTFGANGHTVSLDNFMVVTHDGRSLPPATLTETFAPAAAGKPQRVTVEARQVDLAALAEMAAQLPLSNLQRRALADFAPRGRLLDFSASWDGQYPHLAGYRIKGQVAGLSLRPQAARAAVPAAPGAAADTAQPALPALPGFDNLSGSIDATDKGGSIVLDSRELVLHMPAWFADPAMPFDKLALGARWTYQPQEQLLVEVDKLEFAQGSLRGNLSGRHLLPLGPGHGPGVADVEGTLDGFQIAQVGRFLPLATPEHLRDWLSTALQGGMLNDVRLRLRGDLAEFPFRAENAAARARGEFRVAGRIAGGVLEYAPFHRTPENKPTWPVAEAINGSIVFDRARMEIIGDTLRTQDLNLSNVKAVIPNLGSHEMQLDIDGNAAGALQDFLRYVAASPVLGWIGHFTEDTRGSGNARLGLKLQMPLANLHDTRVQGALQLQENDVQLFPDLPPMQAAVGKVEFSEHGVNLNGVGANFLGGPLALTGGTQRDGAIAIRLAGTLSAEGMRRTAPAPAMARLAQRLSGSTRYGGLVAFRDHQLSVTLDSSLAGLGMDLPAPLNKSEADALPLRFALTGAPTAADGSGRDELRLSLGEAVAARYVRSRAPHGAWTVERGGIGVNLPAPEPDDGMMINVDMKSLNVDNWLATAREIAGEGEAVAGAAAGPNFSQYVIPTTIAARASELFVGERRMADVVVGATHRGNAWQANIHSRQATGYLTWSEGQGQGVGKVTARLASLVIPESQAAEVKALLESNRGASATIPALDIVAEHFELFNKQFGRLDLQASNVQALAGKEWRIDRLSLTNPDGQLKATGRWLTKDGKSNTGMNFTLDILDAGRLLDRLGFPETLRRGKGKLSGDLSWSGLPYALDIPTLSGQIEMNVGGGQFLKQDPGAAKLLGVLSLQMLPRLLKLDFHDVFSEGLAFDGISANAMITRGVVKTDNLKMHGVAATVMMEGTADIANESTDLRVVVIPEFNLGTGPLVYGLAVNPVIGLGSYLAQLFLRAPVMKALTYQMRVTGPWKSPTIIKLDNPPPAAAAKAKE